jgi:hypothetical protein
MLLFEGLMVELDRIDGWLPVDFVRYFERCIERGFQFDGYFCSSWF